MFNTKYIKGFRPRTKLIDKILGSIKRREHKRELQQREGDHISLEVEDIELVTDDAMPTAITVSPHTTSRRDDKEGEQKKHHAKRRQKRGK